MKLNYIYHFAIDAYTSILSSDILGQMAIFLPTFMGSHARLPSL